MSTPPRAQAIGSDHSRWFAEEVQPHDEHLKSYLRGAFPTVRDVDDVVQESYLRLWKARLAHPIECARGFLFRIARNVAINVVNRGRFSPVLAIEDPAALMVIEEGPGVRETVCTREEIRLLARAIDSLPAQCRRIVILRRIKNIPQKEIAAMLGVSESSVESQVYRGVERCAEYLQRQGVKFPR